MKYNLLIKNGRVIDPRNGVDMRGDVGVDAGSVVEVGSDLNPAEAAQVVDAGGRWIVPGVIDPHVHVSSWLGGAPGFRMMAREGVVTALDMAGPPSDVMENLRSSGSGMNIAALEAFHREAGFGAKRGTESGEGPGGREGFSEDEIKRRIEGSLQAGAFGVKLLGGHYPLSPEVTAEVIRLAAQERVYLAFHAGTTVHGSNLEGLREAVELADGRPLHIAHINSYCRGAVAEPLREVQEAVELLQGAPRIRCESYLNPFNGTSGKCRGGRILSEVTKRCCRTGGYADTKEGLAEAIRDGYCRVVELQGGENVHTSGEAGLRAWREAKTDVTVSFPVNIQEAQFALASMKDAEGNFIVDALCTDGGGIPRNSMLRQGLDMVRFGALSPADFVRKTSSNAAEMLGLVEKGHLGPGADGDITVLDPREGRAQMAVAGGRIIMVDGVITGSGGTFITTEKGLGAAERAGVRCAVAEPGKAPRERSG